MHASVPLWYLYRQQSNPHLTPWCSLGGYSLFSPCSSAFPSTFPLPHFHFPEVSHTSRAEGLRHVQLPEPARTGWNWQGSAQLPPLLTETPQSHCCPWHRHQSLGRGDVPKLAGLETWHEPVPTLKEQPPLPHSEHPRAAVLCFRPKPLSEGLLALYTHAPVCCQTRNCNLSKHRAGLSATLQPAKAQSHHIHPHCCALTCRLQGQGLTSTAKTGSRRQESWAAGQS